MPCNFTQCVINSTTFNLLCRHALSWGENCFPSDAISTTARGSSSVWMGASVGGSIGGVLLIAAIAGIVTVVLYKVKREQTDTTR